MGNFTYIGGRLSNILYRSCSVEAGGLSAADPAFPATAVHDGNPGSVFRFSSAAANSYIRAQTELVGRPGFNENTSALDLTPWTDVSCGTGAAIINFTCSFSGAAVLQLAAGTSGVARARVDVTAIPGEYLMVRGTFRAGSTNHIKCTLQNLNTRHYLTTGGTWSTSYVNHGVQTSGADFALAIPPFTVESFAACGYRKTVTLRREIVSTTLSTGSGSPTLADGLQLRVGGDFISIHGHNIPPKITVKVQVAADSTFSSPDTLHTFTSTLQPAFYVKLTSDFLTTSRRFIRVLFEGTPTTAIEIGELWIGKWHELTDNPKYGFEVTKSTPMTETAGVTGRTIRTPLAYHPSEDLQVEFFAMTTAVSCSLRVPELEEMLTRCDWGNEPIVIVPYDAEPNVYLGNISPGLSATRPTVTLYDIDQITLIGSPFTKRIN